MPGGTIGLRAVQEHLVETVVHPRAATHDDLRGRIDRFHARNHAADHAARTHELVVIIVPRIHAVDVAG